METSHSDTEEHELAALIGYALLLQANPAATPSYVPRQVNETVDWMFEEDDDE